MKKLRLEHVLSTSNKNILTVNVDGEMITSDISNSSILVNQTHLFIDNHPKLFHHLIQIQRQNNSLKSACENILFSRREKFLPRKLFPKWNQSAVTVAGGNGRGGHLNQLNWPHGIDIDDDEAIVIAELHSHRIVEKRKDVIIDHHHNNELIIAEWGNQRIARWPRRNGQTGQVIISNVRCVGLAMNNNGDIYVAVEDKHEVRSGKHKVVMKEQ